jgi:small subunit ribosomal protein S20
MPNSVSAKKRLRQNVTLRDRNRARKSEMRSQLRKVREAVEAGDVETSETQFRIAVIKLDKAVSRRVIHRNAAARLKSRMSAKVKALKSAS